MNDALRARKDFLVEHGFAYNNKIKVIQHMLYGFHGDSYFFLKIRAAGHEFGE